MMHNAKIVAITLFISAFSIQSAYSYSHRVENRTDGRIQAIAKYAGESIFSCRPDYVTIEKGQTVDIAAYGCCLDRKIEFKKLSGSNAGATTTFDPQRTGFGIGCVSTHSVVQDIGARISATRPEDAY